MQWHCTRVLSFSMSVWFLRFTVIFYSMSSSSVLSFSMSVWLLRFTVIFYSMSSSSVLSLISMSVWFLRFTVIFYSMSSSSISFNTLAWGSSVRYSADWWTQCCQVQNPHLVPHSLISSSSSRVLQAQQANPRRLHCTHSQKSWKSQKPTYAICKFSWAHKHPSDFVLEVASVP